MGLGDTSLACAAALVDELAAGGVRHACLSPGSRSTPLALALARDERITVHVHLDERASAFFALGIAKVSGEPVAVACTSGTAAAEFLPAVVEASQSRTPLVLLTADRPPDVRGTGANQTIDQTELYGRYARAYFEPPVPITTAQVAAWADTGRRSIETALGEPPGPAHINCPFDEPLVPDASREPPHRTGDRPPPGRRFDDEAARAAVEAFFRANAERRGVITVGGLRHPRTLSVLSLGMLLGWPVLAEPLSGLRLDASGAGRALAAGQQLIGDDGWTADHRPEVVLQVGAAPTTRATQELVRSAGELVVLDHGHLDPDPAHRASTRIRVDPELFGAIAWDLRQDTPPACDPRWQEAWRTADLVARSTVDRLLDGWGEPFEGRVARDVGGFVPHGGVLFVGSSTPVRDLDAYLAPRRPPRIWAEGDLIQTIGNRGASGIDGAVSTVLGAAAGTDAPVYALLGDLTFLHDAGSLLWSARRGHDAVIVVLANGGGEIFSLMPQRGLPEHRDLFVTPHGLDLAAVCGASGAAHTRVTESAGLIPALERGAKAGGVQVVEVTVDPVANARRRNEVRDAVEAALASLH